MNFASKVARVLVAALALAVIPTGLVSAATERVVEYEYDAAGNVIRIITLDQSDPPLIASISPGFINQGQTRTLTASGSNFLGVEVSTEVPGLSIAGVESSDSEVRFQLTAAPTAPIGDAIIRFRTNLGETEDTVFVAEVVPGLSSNPNPITVDLSGDAKAIQLIFSDPRPEDETYTLTTGDPTVATVSVGSFTILAGETQANVSVAGVGEGATDLQIVLPGKFYSYSFPLYAAKSYQDLLAEFPDLQTRNLFANPVGVSVGENNGLFASPVGVRFGDDLEGQLIAKPVGVLFADDLASPVFAPPVGVLFADDLASPVFASPVGVLVSDTTGYAYSTPAGVVYGPLVDSSEPDSATIDSTLDFTITGFNLDEIQAVNVSPSDDVLVGAVSVSPDATQLSVTITIEPAAATGTRELQLEGVSGPVIIRSGAAPTFDIQ